VTIKKDNDMSEQEKTFINEVCKKFDEKYARMQGFLLTIIGVLLAASITVGATQIASGASIKRQVEINTGAIKYIMDNSVSQKAIDLLIVSFENQTEVMNNYFPDDVQGAMKEFNTVSSNLRSNIMMFNSDLNTRGK
jgi:hypothetical protein